MGTTTVFADKAYRVRIINHHQRIVFIGQITDAFQIGDDAIRENTPSVAIRT